MPFDINLGEVNPLLNRMRTTLGSSAVNASLLVTGRKVGVAAEGVVQEDMYPPASGKPLPLHYTRRRKDGSTYKSKFKSLKQQRKVMSLVKNGKVPYRRTGTLGKSITSTAQLSGNGVTVTVGSKLKSAPYVIDAERQSHYHKGTWTPIQVALQKALPMLRVLAAKTLVKEIAKRWKR